MANAPAGRSQKRQANNPEVAFGRVLRSLRQQRGISQDELAHRAGYSRNYVGLIELGKNSPSLRAIITFADVLGVAPSVLIRRMEHETFSMLRQRQS